MVTPTIQADLVRVTYAQLKQLQATSKLAATRYYLLTDFAQVEKVNNSFVTRDKEPLILHATTVATLAPKAYSTTNAVVVAYYQLDNPDADAAGVANTGFVYHRGDPSANTDYVLLSKVFNGLTQLTPGLVLDASQGPVITSLVDSARTTYVDVYATTLDAVQGSVYAYDGILYRRIGPSATITNPNSISSDPANWRPEVANKANPKVVLTNVTETVGGIHRGDSATGTPQEIFNKIFYTYQAPGFNSFTLDGAGTHPVLAGTSFPAGNRAFAWGTYNSQNVGANTIAIKDGASVLADHLANDGGETLPGAAFTLDKGQSRTFTIVGTDTQPQDFAASLTIYGVLARFYGSSSLTPNSVKAQLGNGQPINMAALSLSSDLGQSLPINLTLDCTGGKYVYYLFDGAFPDPATVFAGQNKFSAYTVEPVSITDQLGNARSYKLLYTGIQYGAAVNVNIVN